MQRIFINGVKRFMTSNLVSSRFINKNFILLSQNLNQNNDNSNNNDNNNNDPNKNPKNNFDLKKIFEKFKNDFNNMDNNSKKNIFFSLMILLGISLYYTFYDNFIKTIKYNEFYELLENNEVKNLKIIKVDRQNFNIVNDFSSYVIITLNNGSVLKFIIGNLDNFVNNLEKFITLNNLSPVNIEFSNKSSFLEKSINFMENLSQLMIAGIIFYIIYSNFKSQGKNKMNDSFGNLNFTKSHVKKFKKETNIKIKFEDVAGMDEAKTEIVEFVDFLKNPKKYQKLGAKLPKGALLSGPPGTGKTLLAKACAGESKVPFYFISGSEFVEMFVGVGASRVRELFKEAKKNSPSIIFIDEIDAIGKKRANSMGGSNSELDSTLNQLWVEMDGFDTNSNVIIFAATNRKELLDEALTRPGRFDRMIDVNLPDLDGRKQIFDVYLPTILLSDNWTQERFSKRFSTLTPGFSGADISNICNEAAINAVRKNRESVLPDDFEIAVERIIGGLEKKSMKNEDQKKTVSIHECGHAVTSWFLEGGAPLLKLTIIPRSKGALGFAQYLPNENSLETKEELYDRIITILGGRCAEEHFFGKITTGAYDDLQKAQKTAFAMVTKLGMSDLGYVNYEENEYGQKPYSDKYNEKIDNEIRNIISKATEDCRNLIKKHEQDILNLSEKLMEKQTLSIQDVIEVLGSRPFPMKENFKKYLEEIQDKEFIVEPNTSN